MQASILLIAGNVAEFRQSLELGNQLGRPGIQFLHVRVFDRILKLRAADAIFHRQVLYGLHVERDARHRRQLRP